MWRMVLCNKTECPRAQTRKKLEVGYKYIREEVKTQERENPRRRRTTGGKTEDTRRVSRGAAAYVTSADLLSDDAACEPTWALADVDEGG